MPKKIILLLSSLLILLLSQVPIEAQLIFLEDDWMEMGIFKNLISTQRGLMLLQEEGEESKEGIFTSSIIYTDEPFNSLVASWNAITPGASYVVIEADVKMVHEGWSGWQTLGIWGSGIASRSMNQPSSTESSSFHIDTDLFSIHHEDGALAYRLRARLVPCQEKAPVLTGLGAVTYMEGVDAPREVMKTREPLDLELVVKPRSQLVEDPSIRSRICSPVSLAMVLEYYGHDLSSASLSSKVYDHGARIYGNWSFNTAYAGSLGFRSYVDYFTSLEDVREKIADGIPVVASIQFEEGMLHGAPMQSTNGHLVLITGFTTCEEEEWVITHDPAAPTKDSVRREYLYQEFEEAWRGIVYIVEERE